MKILKCIILVVLASGIASLVRNVFASGVNYNDTTTPPAVSVSPTLSNPVFTGNVGVATTTAQTALAVLGNVGIGTWTAAGGNLIINGGGNVGIGTAWPGKALDVFGDMRLSNSGKYYGDGSQLSSLPAQGSGGWTNSGSVIYNTTATNNVGLGTTTPQAPFVVTNGNVGVGTWTAAGGALIVANGNVGIGTVNANHALELIGSMALTGVILGSDGSTAAPTFSFSSDTNTGMYLAAAADLRFVVNGVDIFRTTSSANYTKAKMNVGGITNGGTNTLNVSGNVGIGTSTSSSYYQTGGVAAGGLMVEGNVGVATVTPQTALAVLGNVGVGTWTAAGGSMIINGGGNVGIGTALPGQLLDVNGNFRVRGTNSIFLGNDNKVGIAASSASAGDIKFTTNNSEVMRITNGGNIGIGTTTAANKMSLLGNIGIGTVSYSSYLTTPGPSGGMIVEGNIGIGTWLPAYPLDIRSSVAAYSMITAGAVFSVGGFIGPIFYDANNTTYLVDPAGDTGVSGVLASNVGITTTTPQGSLVVLSGNVGIGTWAPRAKLIVQGGNVGIGTANANYNLQIGGCTSKTGTTSCVDIAELIPASEALESGDVVMLDKRTPVTVMKALNDQNELLFGAVTTDPAIVIEGGSVGILNGNGFELQPKKPAVALAGRIPVKVNLENGPISVGDMISASSMPGIGAKAVMPQRVIGAALEPMDDLKGKAYQKILVYINPQWWGSMDAITGQIEGLVSENQKLKKRLDALEKK